MPQLARWLTYIEQFDFKVLHRPWTKHENADGLSRKPVEGDDDDEAKDCRCIFADFSDDHLVSFEEDDWSSEDEGKSSDNKVCGFFPVLEIIKKKGELEDSGTCCQTIVRTIQGTAGEEDSTETQLQMLIRAQRQDPELGNVVRMRIDKEHRPSAEELQTETELSKRVVLQWETLEAHNNLVYRRKKNIKDGEPDCLQLLLPRSHVQKMLVECHGGTMLGHFGLQKTKDPVARRFYWNGWKVDVERFCRKCPQRTSYHRGKLTKQGPLKPVLPGAPFERWYIDLTGQHPRSDRKNLWILTCMDSYTKWAKAFAIKNKKAETIAKVLVEQIFTRFGCPLSILSDQGKEVDGRIMAEVCKLFGIEKLRTTPYKPSTNQVERFHRTMNSILAKTVADHHKDWDVRLPYAMAAYRATRHEATGYSPNFLVLHREVRVPVDFMYEAPQEKPAEDYKDLVEKVRERNKRYYGIGLKPKRFVPGQWVLYYNSRKLRGKQMKWQRQYEGLYLVVETHSTLTVKIQQNAKSQSKVVHIDKLKEYPGTPPRSWLVDQSRRALPSTPKSPVDATSYELPQATGQPQLPLQIVSSPATEHSVTDDLVPNDTPDDSMDESESFGRDEDRPDPERPLIGLTAS